MLSVPADQSGKVVRQDAVHALLDAARASGASAAEVSLSSEQGYSITVRDEATDSLEYHTGQGASISVYFGQHCGSASTTDLSDQSLTDILEKACSIARVIEADPCSGLADQDRLALTYPDLDCHHAWDLSVSEAIAQAKDIEDIALAHDSRIIRTEGVSISNSESFSYLANSLGFFGASARSSHSASCTSLAEDASGMQRDYAYTQACNPDDLRDGQLIAQQACDRTLARLNAKSLTSRRVPVVFDARVARSLIGHFLSAIRGGSLYRRASFLLDSLDTQIFPDWMQIENLPVLPGQLGSCAFDGDGVATRNAKIIDQGVLQQYLLGTYSARKLGMETTGHAGGTYTMAVRPSDLSLDQAALLKQMDTGLLVTELMGQGVNMTTGDYSRGAFGFWVEGGEIQYPVTGISIAGNLKEMFQQVLAIGGDVNPQRSVQIGSVLIENMQVAG